MTKAHQPLNHGISENMKVPREVITREKLTSRNIIQRKQVKKHHKKTSRKKVPTQISSQKLIPQPLSKLKDKRELKEGKP